MDIFILELSTLLRTSLLIRKFKCLKNQFLSAKLPILIKAILAMPEDDHYHSHKALGVVALAMFESVVVNYLLTSSTGSNVFIKAIDYTTVEFLSRECQYCRVMKSLCLTACI